MSRLTGVHDTGCHFFLQREEKPGSVHPITAKYNLEAIFRPMEPLSFGTREAGPFFSFFFLFLNLGQWAGFRALGGRRSTLRVIIECSCKSETDPRWAVPVLNLGISLHCLPAWSVRPQVCSVYQVASTSRDANRKEKGVLPQRLNGRWKYAAIAQSNNYIAALHSCSK